MPRTKPFCKEIIPGAFYRLAGYESIYYIRQLGLPMTYPGGVTYCLHWNNKKGCYWTNDPQAEVAMEDTFGRSVYCQARHLERVSRISNNAYTFKIQNPAWGQDGPVITIERECKDFLAAINCTQPFINFKSDLSTIGMLLDKITKRHRNLRLSTIASNHPWLRELPGVLEHYLPLQAPAFGRKELHCGDYFVLDWSMGDTIPFSLIPLYQRPTLMEAYWQALGNHLSDDEWTNVKLVVHNPAWTKNCKVEAILFHE